MKPDWYNALNAHLVKHHEGYLVLCRVLGAILYIVAFELFGWGAVVLVGLAMVLMAFVMPLLEVRDEG